MRKLFLFSLPFGIGTLLCQYLLTGIWRIAAVIAALTAARLVRRKQTRIVTAGLTAGILWFTCYSALYLAPAEALAGTEDTVRLEVLDYAEETDFGARCLVRIVEDSSPRGKAVYYGSGNLLNREPGDRVRTEAKFYSAGTYYAAQGVYLRLSGDEETLITGGHTGSLRYLPQRAAKRLQDTAASIYSQPASGFITALLTGSRDGLDIQSSIVLSETGLMHITAVSGLHCGFLIGLLGALVFRRQRLTALLGYPVLLFYMVMTGCTPSVVRSCIMTGFVLLAPLLNREADPLTSLSGALLLILLGNPFAIASVSLQLSFAAAAGLLLLAPEISAAFQAYRSRFTWVPRRVWNFCVSAIPASLGVMALTAPLNAACFASLPLVAPAANLMVLWMISGFFALALVITALCAVFPLFAPLAIVPEYLTRYVLWTAGLLAKLPGHSVYFTGPAMVLWLVMVYAMLLVCVLSKDRRRKYAVAAIAAAQCVCLRQGVCLLPVWGTAS